MGRRRSGGDEGVLLDDADAERLRDHLDNQRDLFGNREYFAINETLGYELLDPQSRSYDLAVADALG